AGWPGRTGKAGLISTIPNQKGQPFFVSDRTILQESNSINHARERFEWRRVGCFSRLSWWAHQSRHAAAFFPKEAPMIASSAAQTKLRVPASSESSSSRFNN